MKQVSHTGRKVLMLLPSLRISGGVKEAVRLANDLAEQGVQIRIVALWRSEHELSCGSVPVEYLSSFSAKRSFAAIQIPVLLARFFLLLRQLERQDEMHGIVLFLTHFSTFPFAWLAPKLEWFCFNQDVEWMFVREGILRSVLRWFILATSRRSRVFTTNAYVESLYQQEGIRPVGRLSIWASSEWLTSGVSQSRQIDVVMLLRRGHMKRLDLYIEALSLMKREGLSSLVVTPDEEIFALVTKGGSQCMLRPTNESLANIYQRSKIFLLLSDTEGFALPPLEAMGSGCVPLCRDSGGPRCYMTGPLATNLIPLDATTAQICATIQTLLGDTENLRRLSEIAREHFEAGYALTASERTERIASLREIIQTGS